ncbi:hypothetical protein HMPREF9081_1900 [Centipeda periodontii DSM 2778]|uniref:Uncharacterized protein n=1 Tax=Centipeda periodontii DSM 2778 TaxID=888060 RepID=F5RNS9_9FIRM|nr:hypothetical protein HMPREF9081_1900 [Centipeda periodontii DSM 2778]
MMFQSTRPVRGATFRGLTTYLMRYVSIHAPRAGRDPHSLSGFAAISRFQSTRPVRGATVSSCCTAASSMFQSTRPVRGAT